MGTQGGKIGVIDRRNSCLKPQFGKPVHLRLIQALQDPFSSMLLGHANLSTSAHFMSLNDDEVFLLFLSLLLLLLFLFLVVVFQSASSAMLKKTLYNFSRDGLVHAQPFESPSNQTHFR
jgi:hypothetical protein